jgi:hypothetical protein
MISMLLIPLILTIVFETLVLLALREYRAKVLLACVVMNILTNVPLNYYVQNVCPGMSSIIFGEQLVFAVEAVCYRFVTGNWRTALIYSALCNAVSFSMGVLMLCTYELITIPKCRL